MPDRTVRSFLQSPFPSDKNTGLYSPVSLKPDWTAVWGCWTVRSGLFQRSTKKATVRTGPDRGQSIHGGCSSMAAARPWRPLVHGSRSSMAAARLWRPLVHGGRSSMAAARPWWPIVHGGCSFMVATRPWWPLVHGGHSTMAVSCL